ncbi:metalloregulator ArsR/SmtB family transcription factor [Marivita sp.]|uniref:ArsR/SmtB family transcription factor n=1 Tax=Marivita sp. TaxID=2003365 RepID=UPI0026348ADC|nr:metalloregulator ArsR/SmtB family transcription factor [Marivita sp.]
MNQIQLHARALSALGHEARLQIFRVLVKAGHSGLTVSQIAEHLGLPASTQAHHLKMLVDAGLVAQTRQGREVINTVDFDRMNNVIGFLSDECCTGFGANDATTAA